MYELPPLTETARKILKCYVYDLWDTRRDNYAIQPHMIHAYFDEKYPEDKQISLVEINDCIRYFLESDRNTVVFTNYKNEKNLQFYF